MSWPHYPPRRFRHGAAAVEFALPILPFLLLIFGIIESALMLYAYTFVAYSAREATRYAAVHGGASAQPAAATDISNLVTAEAHGLDPTKLTVTTSWLPDNQPGSAVKVRVQYQFIAAIPMLNLSPIILSSTSQVVIAQ